jgi:hypothetical protein
MGQNKHAFEFRGLFWKLAVLLVLLAAGVYLANKFYLEPMREQQRLISNLKAIVSELTKDIRIAEVYVIDQGGDPLLTTFRFAEVDENGDPINSPREITISGDIAYFDSLVIKFEDSYTPIENLPLDTELLRSHLTKKAIIFFRRVFSEKQKPEDGFALDTPGGAPDIYRVDSKTTSFEQKLWKEFWDMANDPKLAASHGVRAAHGQAVYTKLLPGKHYVLEQRLMGDLTIRPVKMPVVLENSLEN